VAWLCFSADGGIGKRWAGILVLFGALREERIMKNCRGYIGHTLISGIIFMLVVCEIARRVGRERDVDVS
jgi:hypothetical protein